MNTKVDLILEELYLIDPSLRDAASRDEEATLRKIIDDLLKSKPQATMDETFAAELKEKLLAEFSKKTRPRRKGIAFIFAKSAFRIGFGIAAAAVVLVSIYVGVRPGARNQNPSSEIAYADGRASQAAPPIAGLPQAGEKDESETANAPELRRVEPSGIETSGKETSGAEAQGAGATRGFNPGGPASPPPTKSSPAKPSPSALSLTAPAGAVATKAKSFAADESADVLVDRFNQDFNTEGYDRVAELSFAKVTEEPLSTFSIDVDTASYANVRRFLRSGSLPPPDAVRIEELVNYFPYDYTGPQGGEEPFAFDAELAPCPWAPAHSLLRVALQAKRIAERDIPPGNLVFLVDVSGSMDEENKLPLVKESLKLLARRLRQQDKIAIVVYAGSAGIALEPTAGSALDRILKAIDDLEAGGSTAGGEGILLAYETAKKAFIPAGSNRVIIATDGDFNVGASSDGELVRLIEEKRKTGVFLSVLGFGMGNYQDSKMQKLADSGNGNYAYVDSLAEADKVLSKQMAGTLFTVAKDVKVQIEFNPARVGEYRLIGYEKRALAARDFADDAKDAGELGAGSSVTALYEIKPPTGAAARGDLKYQSTSITSEGAAMKELMTIKFRYKKPDGSQSSLIEKPVAIEPRELAQASSDFRFAAAVAEWGLVLRGSAYKGDASASQAASLARGALGRDPGGFRAEFLELVAISESLGLGR